MNKDSIKQKLKNYSLKHNKVHQFTLTRYFQERLLYRLSISEYRNQFLLKGGALIYSINKEQSRPTLDIDLLSKTITMNQSDIKTAFADICNLECNDGVVFDDMSIVLTEIKKEGNYSGIRVKFSAKLDSINQSMQIDIGFGDVVVPGPIEIAYPTLIES